MSLSILEDGTDLKDKRVQDRILRFTEFFVINKNIKVLSFYYLEKLFKEAMVRRYY